MGLKAEIDGDLSARGGSGEGAARRED